MPVVELDGRGHSTLSSHPRGSADWTNCKLSRGYPSREPLGFTSIFWQRNDSSRRRVARRHDVLRIHLCRLALQTATRPPGVTFSIAAQDDPLVKSFFRGKDLMNAEVESVLHVALALPAESHSRRGSVAGKLGTAGSSRRGQRLGRGSWNTDWRSTVLATLPPVRPTRFSVRSAVPPSHEDMRFSNLYRA